jgi:beta-glucosidase
MPVTYPIAPNGYTTYDYKAMEVRLGNTYDRLYPFGWGLSFTTFEYSNLNLSSTILIAPKSLVVSVDVQNTGAIEGKEAVLLYLTDMFACVSRPNKQLRGARKITLKPNEKRTIKFTLTMHDLSFINSKNERIYEAGNFNVQLGPQNATFTLRFQNSTTTIQTTKVTKVPETTTVPSGGSAVRAALAMPFLVACSIIYFFMKYF